MKRKRITCAVLCVLLLVPMLSLFCLTAFAEGEAATTSGVLEDLQRDPDFSLADYPQNSEDHSVQVIQVAEGANGELFVYVYRPEGTENAAHRAKYINMSLINPTEQVSSNIFPENSNDFVGPTINRLYSLTWLSASATLEKYLVNDFTISSDADRYYNIAAVYRTFDENIDTEEDKSWDDITGYKGFQVGQCWHFYYYNDALVNEVVEVRVVDIDIKVVGFVGYNDGVSFSGLKKTDAHYVGFSVENYDVNYIYDADVTYFHQSKVETWEDEIKINYGEQEGPETVFISSEDTAENDGSGWFGYKYKWNRIVTKEEFEKQVDEAKREDSWIENNILDGSFDGVQYVFQFLETDRLCERPADPAFAGYGYKCTSTYISDVGILRLHFKTPKGTYNLGVVSDLVSDDGIADIVVGIADNVEHMWEDFAERFEKIMAVILAILLIVVLWPFINPVVSGIFKLVWSVIKLILKIAWKITTWPFKLIGRLLFSKKR